MNIKGYEYITGVFRGEGGQDKVTHLYAGTFANPGNPMCSRGWQRRWYDESGKLIDWEYSIFRNNISRKGICQVCLRRAMNGMSPIEKPRVKRKTDIRYEEV